MTSPGDTSCGSPTPTATPASCCVGAGHRLSVQYHEQKDETSYLLSGRLLLSQGQNADKLDVIEICSGAVWRSEPGVVHTIEALEDSVVLEVSTPELDDLVRLADRYGRTDVPTAK